MNTQRDKKRFIRSLCNSVRNDLIDKVGRMPKEWDGYELRELIALKFSNEALLSTRVYINDEVGRKLDKKRLREFKNDYYSSNL